MPCQRRLSTRRISFEAGVHGVIVILSFSVVAGDCPPLLSRQACSDLDLDISTGTHTLTPKRLRGQCQAATVASNGHYLLPILDYGTTPLLSQSEGVKVVHRGTEATITSLGLRPSRRERRETRVGVASAQIASIEIWRRHSPP